MHTLKIHSPQHQYSGRIECWVVSSYPQGSVQCYTNNNSICVVVDRERHHPDQSLQLDHTRNTIDLYSLYVSIMSLVQPLGVRNNNTQDNHRATHKRGSEDDFKVGHVL